MKVWISILFLTWASMATAKPAQIILIRHAEKPDSKSPDLSEKGFQRAQALVRIFDVYPQLAVQGKPEYIFATKYVPGDSARRTYQTVEPLAKDLNLPIDDSNLTENFQDLADELLKDPKYNGKSVFIAWTHTYIVDFAKTLGSTPSNKWKSDVFDRLWVIQYDHNGRAHSFDLPQKLLPGDSTK